MGRLLGRHYEKDFAKQLLLIHHHGAEFPNSGPLIRALGEFDRRLQRAKKPRDLRVPNAIALDLAYSIPRAFPHCSMIISRLHPVLPTTSERTEIIEKIHAKMTQLPYNGHMEVWLQRIGRNLHPNLQYSEKLCQIAQGLPNIELWNGTWLKNPALELGLSGVAVVDRATLRRTPPSVRPSEVSLFELSDY